MKPFTKNFIMVCGIYVLTQLPGHNIALAANNVDNPSANSYKITQTKISTSVTDDDTYYINKENTTSSTSETLNSENGNVINKEDIPVNKTWQIKFNQPVDINLLSGKIKLINKGTGKEVPIGMDSDSIEQCITVKPLINLDPQTEYYIYMSPDIVSKFKKQLSNPTVVNFTTSAVITSIDDVEATIEQESSYSLPSKVNANMSDGTIKAVDVSWDRPLNSTSIPGSYTFTGTIPDYGTIKLHLTINPFKPVTSISNDKRTQSSTGLNLYNYLMNYKNRNDVLTRAEKIHAAELPADDPSSNNCAFYQSEALRSIGVNIPKSTANTLGLTKVLENLGWKISTDLSLLLPGDICFTISYDPSGPTHTYTFMKWVDPKNFNYAYICDNQGNEYNNDAYHERNINFQTQTKDKISYFMYL